MKSGPISFEKLNCVGHMIPEFGIGNILPPFMGSDAVGAQLPRSPYVATAVGLVERFCTSPARATILRGFLAFRAALRDLGFTDGFQWIDGSFVEDCESDRGRPPNDIDVVSLLVRPVEVREEAAWGAFINENLAAIFTSATNKQNFHCDSYFVDLDIEAREVAEQGAYWFGLFSHQRDTFRWKGLVQIELVSDDEAAQTLINEREQGW
ncbi:MAG: hypothetical protein E5Y79_34390 [Mesorhizobium sp.]|uniref:DUF6932 family protein n=1 Tax=Mesorhizobium sp. TaxID=1871066 RepID=UPI0011F7CDA7|nr:hypothetical protein [Mesorhizobium sp.]TIL55425.1 MAG: hypothetical protein E5Y79_34390 [Mesorhizobium sp.]